MPEQMPTIVTESQFEASRASAGKEDSSATGVHDSFHKYGGPESV